MRRYIKKNILAGIMAFAMLMTTNGFLSEAAQYDEENSVVMGTEDIQGEDTASNAEALGLENSWRYSNGVPLNGTDDNNPLLRNASTATTFLPSPNAGKKGIDVSEHNGEINWEKVKAAGIEFAIIRCGYGMDNVNQDDKRWLYNVSECERLGIPYGVYLYSYATDEARAASEAQHVIRLLKGHTPTYPVYYDMEDNSTLGVGNERLAVFAKIFCDALSEAGYPVGIYANKYWWEHYLTDGVFNNTAWSKWVAQYPYATNSVFQCSYTGTYDIWQFTSNGYIDGIGKNVDLNYMVTNKSFQAVPVSAKVSYTTHIQNIGWETVQRVDGATSGTSGRSLRLEAIRINNRTGISGDVEYQVHCQNYGWMAWKKNGELAGTSGEAKRLEAIRIRLTGELANAYDVYYRVHSQNYGWLGWTKNGETAGTRGLAYRLEAIQIMFLPKGQRPTSGNTGIAYLEYAKGAGNASNAGYVNYRTHVQNIGDQSYVYDGSFAGTSGEAKRLEAININVNTDKLGVTGGITYRTHVQNEGWQGWKSNGEKSGTSGRALRLEAIQIKLTGELESKYDIYYRTHIQNYGWLAWAKNGEASGSEGKALRMEAMQIVIVPKGDPAPNYYQACNTSASFIK